MVADRRFSSGDETSSPEERRKKFWVNVLLGAVVTFAVGVIPLVKVVAPVGGGALAGYLRNAGTIDGAKIGALAAAIGGVGLNFLAPPRFFGLLSGDVGNEVYLIVVFLGFAVWVVTGAFGGALGARLAEDRYGPSRDRR